MKRNIIDFADLSEDTKERRAILGRTKRQFNRIVDRYNRNKVTFVKTFIKLSSTEDKENVTASSKKVTVAPSSSLYEFHHEDHPNGVVGKRWFDQVLRKIHEIVLKDFHVTTKGTTEPDEKKLIARLQNAFWKGSRGTMAWLSRQYGQAYTSGRELTFNRPKKGTFSFLVPGSKGPGTFVMYLVASVNSEWCQK